jgi:hypothetical protein
VIPIRVRSSSFQQQDLIISQTLTPTGFPSVVMLKKIEKKESLGIDLDDSI